jgi:hypothetical protein
MFTESGAEDLSSSASTPSTQEQDALKQLIALLADLEVMGAQAPPSQASKVQTSEVAPANNDPAKSLPSHAAIDHSISDTSLSNPSAIAAQDAKSSLTNGQIIDISGTALSQPNVTVAGSTNGVASSTNGSLKENGSLKKKRVLRPSRTLNPTPLIVLFQ